MKHIKMPKALAEKWLADLRSGEYQQCAGRMTDGTGFCCLGVLQMGVSGKIIPAGDGELPNRDWLRSKNIDFFGMYGNRTNSPYDNNKEQFYSELNDEKVSFQKIADLLEDEIEYNDE